MMFISLPDANAFPHLLSPVKLGALSLPNRVIMAPLTRARATRDHRPTAVMAKYYAQRATAGLIIAEASMVSPTASSFIHEPGIYDDVHIEDWRRVTDAVHAEGGRIILQLWHPGRASHSLLDHGVQPVSSSTRPLKNFEIHTPLGKKPFEIPRRLVDEEIPAIVDLFRQATRRAMAAGFDGVQVHGAHGYLLDQFLRDGMNDRSGRYGGAVENRARLLLEVIDAAIAEAGSDRVGLRLSVLHGSGDCVDSSPIVLASYVAGELRKRGIAFVELRHTDQARDSELELVQAVKQHFGGAVVRNGAFDLKAAEDELKAGHGDAVAFGRYFIGNPDLVRRIYLGAPLAESDPTSWYQGGVDGYSDYPSLKEHAGVESLQR